VDLASRVSYWSRTILLQPTLPDPAFCQSSPPKNVTANFGMTMPEWYVIAERCSQHLYHWVRTCRFDIKSFDFKADEDESGMLGTVSSVNQLISAEVDSGIDPGRIVVGGFSQGGAMSILAGLTSERKLAGVVSLSGWVALRNKLKAVGGLQVFGNTLC
jgi:lysophospholipase-1